MAIPIPRRPSGFLLGKADALVTIDVFLDIQCPHSRAAWPSLMVLMESYKDKSLSLRVHLLTLSNHRQAWDVSLGIFALAEGDAERCRDFVSFLFERQEQFNNAAFSNKSHVDLQQLVADLAQEHGAADRNAFLERMQSHEIYVDARTPIRYAATKSVWATPTFFVNNGDNVPVDHKSDLSAWQQLLDPLFV
ncbi:thioredoxin domain-containing protein [uncultured Pseudoteredinibacter sp.]|uniref:DsbA family protein n=1 Tax=uncultured Pseudoteredinibacter sp. TaxID=1641701 RepID=UPI00260B4BDA|nr:thioredoxin domain-containing protein [uncultured Pseudoteredinibacter sp.]